MDTRTTDGRTAEEAQWSRVDPHMPTPLREVMHNISAMRALTPAAPPPLYAVAQSPEFVRQYPAGKGGRGGILILQIIFESGE